MLCFVDVCSFLHIPSFGKIDNYNVRYFLQRKKRNMYYLISIIEDCLINKGIACRRGFNELYVYPEQEFEGKDGGN